MTGWSLTMPVMQDILKSTIADPRLEVPVVFATMNVINSVTYVAAFSIVITSCAILLPRTTATADAENNTDPDKKADASGDAPARLLTN
jgi:hypothetical protein